MKFMASHSMTGSSCAKATTALADIKSGEVVVYHVGDLKLDRLGKTLRANAVDGLASLAYNMAREKPARVFLTQRRRGKDRYDYIATGI
jgi:hypothetical protein